MLAESTEENTTTRAAIKARRSRFTFDAIPKFKLLFDHTAQTMSIDEITRSCQFERVYLPYSQNLKVIKKW